MIPENIAFLFILAFFLIVFIQSGIDKIIDYKGNLTFLKGLFKAFFSQPLITLALISVTILEVISGVLCLIGIGDFILNDSSFIGLLGLITGSFALLILLFGQRVSKNYEGAKTITIYFILAMIGIVLA
ncbi:DoxX family protein [Flavobacteriaceae bacterium]|nr:DoxX family protein [Flavobacteriaceae bacterium]